MGKAFDLSLLGTFLPELLAYLPTTLLILAASLFFGLLLGLLLAIPRLYNIPVLTQLVVVYVSFIRGTPVLIQLFLVYYGLPAVLGLVHLDLSRADPLLFVIVTYALSSAAFLSETIRGSVNSVDLGQTEAAYAVGMTARQAFRRIVLPQALMVTVPNFANKVIGFLKDTSLAFTIGVMDMMGRGQTLISATAHALEVYISLAVIYYLVVIVLERLFAASERKLQQHERKWASA